MSELSGASLVAIAVALLWIAVAAWLSLAAARRLRSASAVLNSARAMGTLLEVAPARPLLVRTDGRIEVDPRLLRELGVAKAPATLVDLAGSDAGLEKDDVDGLAADCRDAALTGGKVGRKVRAAG